VGQIVVNNGMEDAISFAFVFKKYKAKLGCFILANIDHRGKNPQ